MPEITEEQIQRLVYHLTELDSISRQNGQHCHAAFEVLGEVADIDDIAHKMDYDAVRGAEAE